MVTWGNWKRETKRQKAKIKMDKKRTRSQERESRVGDPSSGGVRDVGGKFGPTVRSVLWSDGKNYEAE